MLKTVSSIVNALGALNYKGTWNADTNTPTLASGVGNQGDYYVVSVAGTTDLDGTTNWGIGDWAVFNGSIWERLEGGADGNFVNLSVSNEATFPDNAKAIFGTGSGDLEIYHDGSHSYIKDTATGNLRIDGTDIQIRSTAGANMAAFVTGAEVQLYHNNQKKFETVATGIDITGDIVLGDSNPTITFEDSSITNLSHTVSSASNNLRLTVDVNGVDAGSRVEIFDGTTEVARFEAGAVNVTGSVTADGLQVTNTATTGTDQEIASFRTASGGGLVIRSSDLSAANPDSILEPFFGESLKIKTSGNDRFKVADNGDISFYDDAAAQGLFWDSSASMLGLGTTIPGQKLEIKESSAGAGDAIIRLRGNGNNADNTPLGSLEWFNTDSSGPQPGVVAAVEAQSANANGHMGKLLFKTHDGSGSEADPPTTRMTINESGLVGIGTSAPAYLMHLEDSNGADLALSNSTASPSAGDYLGRIYALDSGDNFFAGINMFYHDDNDGEIRFRVKTDGTNADIMTLVDGSVGIGTSSPIAASNYANLTLNGDAGGQVHFADNDVKVATISSSVNDLYVQSGAQTIFRNGGFASGDEAFRIDSSKNLLVGQTVGNVYNQAAVTGLKLDGANGNIQTARSSNPSLLLNRYGTDGSIAELYKDGTIVGSTGVVNSDNLRIGGVVTDHAGLQFGTNILIPETAGTASDGLVDIGTGANRYQDVYATNGTIQTSDGNEKQDIEELSEAEQRVAVVAKGLLRKFRWKSAVEAKGDEARTHFGIIAQDLQAAFSAEGLDAGDYGMFINSTWTDEETGEERSRMGVRYSELLAFIISAI